MKFSYLKVHKKIHYILTKYNCKNKSLPNHFNNYKITL